MFARSNSAVMDQKWSDRPENTGLERRAQPLRILKVQRTCVHDGPGVRTTIFFRGCNLRCAWCQNPEAISYEPDPARDETASTEEIIAIALRDKEYYAKTGGGVTLSGGDPLAQNPSSLKPLLEALKAEQIHVTVETSLFVPWRHVEDLAPYISLFIVDLKAVGDEELHRRCTKQGNRLIQSNIRALLKRDAHVRFRMVMVPGYNDADENIQAASEFLKSVERPSIELLKYHRMYEDKAKRLGLDIPELNISDDQATASVRNARVRFNDLGIRAECLELENTRRKAVFSKRVHDIQDAIRGSGHSLCIEVSSLKTDFYKKNGFSKSPYIHRAERLAYVLANKKVIIYPQELLVGNFTSKRRGCQVWEEHCGFLIGTLLHQIEHQKPIPFQISWKDRIRFYRYIAPFWMKHSLFSKVYPTARQLWPSLARSSEMRTGFNNNMASIAHFVVNYERLLEAGTSGLIEEIERKRREDPRKNPDFYEGTILALKALETFAGRYADHLTDLSRSEADPVRRAELEGMAAICRRVPRHPARTYHEALQSMLFLHIALCIETFENALSPGRLDQILFPYYERDKAAGRIDYERAKELLALFILKMDEAILVNDGNTFLRIGRLFETMSTDQTVTAGGLGKNGRDATNDLTYALLDICELQPYSVNMTARIHPDSPPEYLERLAEVYINGAPMPALYNDDLYVKTLTKHYDTTVEEARNYAIIGCVEPNASDDHFGNTDCANVNVVLPFLQALRGEEDDLWTRDTPDQVEQVTSKFVDYVFDGKGRVSKRLHSSYVKARDLYKRARKTGIAPPSDMSELLERYQRRLNILTNSILADHQKIEKVIRENFPTPLASALSRGCVERGLDVNEGGSRFNSSGIQAVGVTDVADSLHALDVVVFRKKLFGIREVIDAMDRNFAGEGDAPIREALRAVPKFGQDESTEAVEWVNRTLEIYVNALAQVPDCPRNGRYSAGYYALNVNDVYGKKTPALPSGRQAGVPLANSITPHYGMKSGDLLSALNSVSGVDFVKYAPNGTTVTFTIDSALFQGANGVRNLAGIFSTFFKMGGMQFQPNVINREILLDAYEHPEKYPYLLVRVAGYCAYFNDLSDDLKKIIINRTCYH